MGLFIDKTIQSLNEHGSGGQCTKFGFWSEKKSKNLDDICGRPTQLWFYISHSSAGKLPDPHILLLMTLVCGINFYYLWFSVAGASLQGCQKMFCPSHWKSSVSVRLI